MFFSNRRLGPQPFNYIMSKLTLNRAYKTCVIGDPSFMTNVHDVRSAIKNKSEPHINYLTVQLADNLYEKLCKSEPTVDFEVHSDKNDESFFAIGDISNIEGSHFLTYNLDIDNIKNSTLTYLGSITSESSLFVIAHDPINLSLGNNDTNQMEEGRTHANIEQIKEEGRCADNGDKNETIEEESHLSVDWEDFMLTTLDDPTLQVDLESFPLYLMFGRIPEQDSILSIFGIPTFDSLAYSALILRSKDCIKINSKGNSDKDNDSD